MNSEKTNQALLNLHEQEKKIQLMKPLVDYLIPIRKEMLMKRMSFDDLNIDLEKSKWPEQFKENIDKVVGVKINWV